MGRLIETGDRLVARLDIEVDPMTRDEIRLLVDRKFRDEFRVLVISNLTGRLVLSSTDDSKILAGPECSRYAQSIAGKRFQLSCNKIHIRQNDLVTYSPSKSAPVQRIRETVSAVVEWLEGRCRFTTIDSF